MIICAHATTSLGIFPWQEDTPSLSGPLLDHTHPVHPGATLDPHAAQHCAWVLLFNFTNSLPPDTSTPGLALAHLLGVGPGAGAGEGGVGGPSGWKHQGKLLGFGLTGLQQQPTASQDLWLVPMCPQSDREETVQFNPSEAILLTLEAGKMSLGEEKDTRLGEEVMILPFASWNSKAPVSGFTEMPPKAVRMPTNPLFVVRVNEGRIDLDSGATIGVSICFGLFFAAEIRNDPGAATANSRLTPR